MEDEAFEPDDTDFQNEERHFSFMSWNGGNAGRSTAARGRLATAVSYGARIAVPQQTPFCQHCDQQSIL